MKGIAGRRRVAMFAAGALLSTLLVASTGASADGGYSECGGRWSGEADCILTFEGGPLYVTGTAKGHVGDWLEVHVSIEWPPGALVQNTPDTSASILSCGDATEDFNQISCASELNLVANGFDPTGLAGIRCHVEGAPSGTFHCASGVKPL